MALKQLMNRRRHSALSAQLEELRTKDAEFDQRKADMDTRETELEAAVNEIDENTPDEEKTEVETAVNEFETEKAELERQMQEHEDAKNALAQQIAQLDSELAELNERSKNIEKPVPTVPTAQEERKDEAIMETRTNFFGMTVRERDAFVARQDMKDFLQRVREMMKNRASNITGKELLIPDVALELLRENISLYSKLAGVVNLRYVTGKARQRIMGAVPEAVWTEMCAKLNELKMSFNQVEVDGFKVGGFMAVCNAVLEDNDVNLAREILNALGQAIGLALDKAILYGTGTKMPMGIATRLAAASAPEDYDTTTAPAWKDVSTSNVVTVDGSLSGTKFYAALMEAAGNADSSYSTGGKVWIMSEKTRMTLMTKMLAVDSSGAVASGVTNSLPLIGGQIITLSNRIIPDGTIIGGYGSMYLLVERAGTSIAQSEHARFIEDETVFKATARYDGMPVFGEAFVAIGIGAAPTMTASFEQDKANAA